MKTSKKPGVYFIYNIFHELGRFGEGKNVQKRLKDHKKNLLNYFPESWVDENFVFYILETHEEDNRKFRLERESYFIEKFKGSINLTNISQPKSW